MKLYLCRGCGKLCRRGAQVCWNCGVRWPGLPVWLSMPLRLVLNRFSWALVVFLVGGFVLYHALPPTKIDRLAHERLENGRPVVALKERAVGESKRQTVSRGSSAKPKIEVAQGAAEEKSGPEEIPALETERHPAETIKHAGDDGPSIDTWSVQVAAFRDESDAERLVDRLKQEGYETFIVSGERWYRVLVGEFVSFKEAGEVKDTLAQEQGFNDAFIRKG